jgi:ferric-dicitrate binding protein FerR (iron transport regulator)
MNLDGLDGFLRDLEQMLPVRVTPDPDGSVRVSLLTEQPGAGLR